MHVNDKRPSDLTKDFTQQYKDAVSTFSFSWNFGTSLDKDSEEKDNFNIITLLFIVTFLNLDTMMT